jgi:AP-4 complex subunit sigma-1
MFQGLLIVNKQGQTKFSRYFAEVDKEERTLLEAELARKCLSRTHKQVDCISMPIYIE